MHSKFPEIESPLGLSARRARDIVASYGWSSTSYQILNPGIHRWFSRKHQAVVGYARRGDVLLVAGEPVCEGKALAAVCQEFEAFASRHGCTTCYVCAEERLRGLFERSPRHATVALGAQPVWHPGRWPEIIRSRASLRAQLRLVRNKGVVVESMATESAIADLHLRGILRSWLDRHHLPPLEFLAGRNVLEGVLTDRVILQARWRGAPVGFLVASPIQNRNGYLIELVARSSAAPNGTSELLIDSAMRGFADRGCEHVTLGLVALAHAADAVIRKNPVWLRALMYFARAHANRLYNFRGLEHFRAKMAPSRWEMIYAISSEPRFTARILYAMGSAFSGTPPWAAVASGMRKFASGECRNVIRRLSPSFALPHSTVCHRFE